MRNPNDSSRVAVVSLLLTLFLAPNLPAQSDDFDHIGTRQAPNAVPWGGLRWSTSEVNAFQGRPQLATDNDTNHYVTVAYDRFISYYDCRCQQAFRSGTHRAFRFQRSCAGGLGAVAQVPKDISALKARSKPAIIERGHLTPNNTMKCWGTKAKGKKAQFESFSLANVVPQMNAPNAPTWSALEAQCLGWAKALGSVCVVAGPIYKDPAHPRHIQERRTEMALDIPFADALFCVVIGKRDNKTVAIGFIMPQLTTGYSYRDKAVPIDQIEQATGINFMPLLNEPNPLEQTVDQRWLNN